MSLQKGYRILALRKSERGCSRFLRFAVLPALRLLLVVRYDADVSTAFKIRGLYFGYVIDTVLPQHAFELGARDYLAKPFSFDELVARVRVQLKQVGGVDSRVLHAGALALDIARREASIGTLVTNLSDREFRLLHHLVEHAGEVVSRESLLSEVWGYSFDPGSNVVDVCVRRLRKKLGPQAPIETVRHAGYRLRAA